MRLSKSNRTRYFRGFMNSKLLILMSMLLVAGLATGCAARDRQPVYVGSDEVQPIRAPEGLSQPRVRTTYQIPGYFLPELAAVGNEARPPRVLPSAEAEASRSHIRFGPTGLFLEVQDEADSVWRRLSFALNRGGMNVRTVDESARRYLFDFRHDPIALDRTGLSRLAFWRGTEVMDYSGRFRAEVQPDGDNARVILLHQDGRVIDMETAEFVLAVLRERLG